MADDQAKDQGTETTKASKLKAVDANQPAPADVTADTTQPTDSSVIPGTPQMIRKPEYDLARINQIANRSIQTDDQGRFVIRYSGDGTDGLKSPDTTFATRDLAYKQAVSDLKASGQFPAPGAAA